MMEWRGRRRQQQEEEGGWWGPTNRHSGKKYGRQPPSPAGNLSSKGSLLGFCRVCSLISFPFFFLGFWIFPVRFFSCCCVGRSIDCIGRVCRGKVRIIGVSSNLVVRLGGRMLIVEIDSFIMDGISSVDWSWKFHSFFFFLSIFDLSSFQ